MRSLTIYTGRWSIVHEQTVFTSHINLAARERSGDEVISEEEAEAWRVHQQNSKKRTYYEWKEAEHPGCQLSGHLLLDRTPGKYVEWSECCCCCCCFVIADSKSWSLSQALF